MKLEELYHAIEAGETTVEHSAWLSQYLNGIQAQFETFDYAFKASQMWTTIHGAVGLFLEFKDVHGKDRDTAMLLATNEVMDGLDADKELYEQGIYLKSSLQVLGLGIGEHF